MFSASKYLDTFFAYYGLHDLRHTAATILLQIDANPRLVPDLLGHSSITTTLDVYSHVLPPMKSEVADKMDEVFK